MGKPISQDEFNDLLRTFRRSAFRFEARSQYALDYEKEDFRRFLDGRPTAPPEVGWWHPWLDQIARFAREGKTVTRTRVLAEPPTDYQRWEVWATPWHARAGEDIRYMRRGTAERLGLPLDHDWWLLDDERLIVIRYTDADEIASKDLSTEPGTVAPYRAWRDLAVRNAIPAGETAA